MNLRRTSEAWPALRRPRRARRRAMLALLVLPLLSGLFVASPAGPVAGDELSAAQAEQARLKAQIKDQKAEAARLEAAQREVSAQIKQTTGQLNQINVDLTTVKHQITKLEAQIAVTEDAYQDLVRHLDVLALILERLETQAADKQAELARAKAQLADRIRAAYDADRTTVLETILAGSSFTDIVVTASYEVEVAAANQALANRIVDEQAVLATLEVSVSDTQVQTGELRDVTAARKAELDQDKADLDAAKAQLKKLEKETKRALAIQEANYAKLAQTKAQVEKALAESSAAQKKLAKKISSMLAAQQNLGNIPSQYNGTLQWPLAGTITQNFGCTGFSWEPPLGSCAHYHQGIDIAAPMYTPIRAAGDGTVLFAGPNPYDPYPKAWIVIIAHSSELLTWYAHVDNATKPPAVRAGEHVDAGDVIAYVGMTGRTTGPHLHWMVEFRDQFANPRLFL